MNCSAIPLQAYKKITQSTQLHQKTNIQTILYLTEQSSHHYWLYEYLLRLSYVMCSAPPAPYICNSNCMLSSQKKTTAVIWMCELCFILPCILYHSQTFYQIKTYNLLWGQREKPQKSFGGGARLNGTCIAKVKNAALQRCHVELVLITAMSLFWGGN